MYKLLPDTTTGMCMCVHYLIEHSFIPFDPANTDYQTFKSQINADEAQLEDADGVLMSPDAAVAFISNLP